IYGGAIAYLADAGMIVATGSTVPAGTAFNTIDLKVNFLRPVLPERDELRAQAAVVHRGRTISLVNCDIIDANGKLAARATSSFLMLPGRFWEHPVHVGNELQQAANAAASCASTQASSRHAQCLVDLRGRGSDRQRHGQDADSDPHRITSWL